MRIIVLLAAVALAATFAVQGATGGQESGAVWAIRHAFSPRYADEAVRVAWCESRLTTTARNGQYFGLFQMGSQERRLYAHGRYRTALDQARAARNYFRASGRDWSPWTCKP